MATQPPSFLAQSVSSGMQRIGESQQDFRQRAHARYVELQSQGMKACTIINFNPVELRLEGELKRYKIPSPYDTRLPDKTGRIVMEWQGRDYVGHYITIRDPHIYGKVVNAVNSGVPGEVAQEREVREYLPIAIGYIFLEHFSPIFATKQNQMAAPPPTDARRIYGVMAFEGDIHRIEPQALHENKLIRVPLANLYVYGKRQQRMYETVEYDIDRFKDEMFRGQLRYADAIITRAQQKFAEGEEGIKQISESDKIWYRWAIQMGYVEGPKPGEKTWLTDTITLTLNTMGTVPRSMLRKCQACRQTEPEPGTPFCPKCGAPIDTFTTFMAGYPVQESWLQTLKGEEREAVLFELRERRKGFDEPATLSEPGEAKPLSPALEQRLEAAGMSRDASGKFTTGHSKKNKVIDHIPDASSTKMPGEE